MKITNLKQVVEYQLCCGCGLCAYLHPDRIRMIDMPDYGLRPEFTGIEKSSLFHETLKMCPGFTLSGSRDDNLVAETIAELKNEWGNVVDLWEGYAADPEIRFNGSSGGALTALAMYCLERREMQGVLQTAADPEKPFLNQTVLSQNREDLLKATGSRYAPACPCAQLQTVAQASGPCVFIGKPCDVAGVYNAMKQRGDLKQKIGITMACFCAGTPSTTGTMAMIKSMGVDNVESLSELRYRGRGWPGKTTVYYRKNGRQHRAELTYEESWGQILQKYRQWRCYICPDHTGQLADIATGDPWYNAVESEEQGRSLILARTDLGRQVIEEAVASGYLVAKKVNSDRLPASQPNLLKARARLWGQLQTLRLAGAPVPHLKGFGLFSTWLRYSSLRQKLQSFAGTAKRIRRKRLRFGISMQSGGE